MAADQLKEGILALPPAQRLELLRWLQDLVDAEPEAPDVPVRAGREVVEVRRVGSVTLSLEMIRCGKPTCKKCPHGPYYYGYWLERGSRRCKYIGKSPSAAQYFAEAKNREGFRMGGAAAGRLTETPEEEPAE